MRTFVVLALLALALPALVPPAAAGPQWLPYCKEERVDVGGLVVAYVSLDCEREAWVDVCPPPSLRIACRHVDLLALA